METIYFKLETRVRLTDEELEEACWKTIENSGKICSVVARRNLDELTEYDSTIIKPNPNEKLRNGKNPTAKKIDVKFAESEKDTKLGANE